MSNLSDDELLYRAVNNARILRNPFSAAGKSLLHNVEHNRKNDQDDDI